MNRPCKLCKYCMDCKYVPALESCNEDSGFYAFEEDDEV